MFKVESGKKNSSLCVHFLMPSPLAFPMSSRMFFPENLFVPFGGRSLENLTNCVLFTAGYPRGVFKQTLRKPDGRNLLLFSRQPIPDGIVATSPSLEPLEANPHLRWHPLRGEWVTYAAHRQNRTFLPPPEYNPLAPTKDASFPTELPAGEYDIAVFPNRFPSLIGTANNPPSSLTPTAPGRGECEVVVFTQDANTSLGGLPLDHIQLLIGVWADRYTALGALDHVQYVLPFENRGVEMGVTLYHPHGQIYA